MSIQDFRAETKRRGSRGRRQVSEAEKELHDFTLTTYRSIEDGDTRVWVREIGELLTKNIAPTCLQQTALRQSFALRELF